MVRKIKKQNKEKIKVRIDGKGYRMTFATAKKAIAKSKQSYFREDGSIELSNFPKEKDKDDTAEAAKGENEDGGGI